MAGRSARSGQVKRHPLLELHHTGNLYRVRSPSLPFKGKKADFRDGGGDLSLRVCRAQRQLRRRLAAGEGAFSPHLLLQDLMAQQTVEFGDFHLVSSVPSHHCRQMAFIKLLSFIFHLDSCPLLIREIRG